MMERYNLSVPRNYTSNGEEKTAWDYVGVMFARDKGGFSIKLSMFPELSIFAFPPKDGDNRGGGSKADGKPKDGDENDHIPW